MKEVIEEVIEIEGDLEVVLEGKKKPPGKKEKKDKKDEKTEESIDCAIC